MQALGEPRGEGRGPDGQLTQRGHHVQHRLRGQEEQVHGPLALGGADVGPAAEERQVRDAGGEVQGPGRHVGGLAIGGDERGVQELRGGAASRA